MAEANRVVEIDNAPALLQLVEEARATGRPILLSRGGTELARIEPVLAPKPRRRRAFTEADVAASKSAAGGWRGVVDVERFHADLAESRRVSVSRRTPFKR